MIHQDQLNEWLQVLAGQVSGPCDMYLFGGCAMNLRGLKDATKDVDLIVSSKREFAQINQVLLRAGFNHATNQSVYLRTAMSAFAHGDSRIDIFVRQVGNLLCLTDSMKRRATLHCSHQAAKVYLCANEDIFLFKSMTSREMDVNDCARLVRAGLDFQIIYQECMEQSSEDRLYFLLYEKVCAIEHSHHLPLILKQSLESAMTGNWRNRRQSFDGPWPA